MKEIGLGQITDEQCRSFVGNGAKHLIEKSIAAAGDPELTFAEKALEVYKGIFKDHCTYRVTPYPGVTALLEELKSKGIKLAVLSNKPHLQTIAVVNEILGEGLFDWVQGQQEGVPRKPDPTAALYIAEKFQLPKEACVYIGDSDVDMQTGNAAGMKTVGVTWGFRSKDVLLAHGAQHIIDSANELIAIVEAKGVI